VFLDGDFKKLQAFWYAQLKKSGFEDAESLREDFCDLKKDGWYFKRNYTSERIQDSADYYQKASDFYWRFKFKREEKIIWKFHMEGASRRQIARELNVSDSKIQIILTRLKKEMMNQPEEKIKKSELFKRRKFQEDDRKFILQSWLKGYYHGNSVIKKSSVDSEGKTKERFFGNSWLRLINERLFNENYSKVLAQILMRDVEIPIISLVAEPSVILGYAVIEGSKLHWIFVKEMWRGIGLAKDLLKPHVITECSHLTSVGQLIKPTHIQFNPFL